MQRRILIVDGASPALGELRDRLASLAGTWEFQSAASGEDGLRQLGTRPFHAVVADSQLVDLPGMEFATRVMKEHPPVHRILLADPGNLRELFRLVGGVHSFLTQPCDPSRLLLTLQRAFQFEVWLPNQAVRELLGRIPKLPSPSEAYSAVVRELQSPQRSPERVARLISADPLMTAKLLHLANSAAYGPPPDEADPVAAIREIGLENTAGMILLSHTFSSFRDQDPATFSATALWDHARRVGRMAGWIAELQDAPGIVRSQSATSGLLHDLGKLALAANLPDLYREARRRETTEGRASWEAELDVFGATHSEVGGWLLGIWGLPAAVVEAVALHHHPTRFLSDSFSPLTAVHLANAFAGPGTLPEAMKRLDRTYLAELDLLERVEAWWRECLRREKAVGAAPAQP